MDHSIESYIERQSTEVLRLLLQQHKQLPETEHTRYIIELILAAPENREQPNP